MQIPTGYTVNEIILSLDSNNNPQSGATFTTEMFQNGAIITGVTINTTLVDAPRGVFDLSWSASTTGDYQLYAKNNITSTVFLSDIVRVLPNSTFQTSIYVGL